MTNVTLQATCGRLVDLEPNPLFASFVPPAAQDLVALEREVEQQLAAPDTICLNLLGFGEITIAVAYPSLAPTWACKRMPPTLSESAAWKFAEYIECYMRRLHDVGVKTIPTAFYVVRSSSGRFALYLCQPILDRGLLGPAIMKARVPRDDDEVLNGILIALRRATGPNLGIDPQIANWAWIDGEPWLLDISTPLMREPDGRVELDLRLLTAPYPAFVRPILRRWVAPPMIVKYFSLRNVFVEFVAYLRKDRLDDWVEVGVRAANRMCDAPISVAEVRKYYDDDARLWEFAYKAKVLEKNLSKLIGRTYQYILPPAMDRGT